MDQFGSISMLVNSLLKHTIPESGMMWSLVHVTGGEKRHPWAEQYSQTSWEPTSDNNNILKTKIKGNDSVSKFHCTVEPPISKHPQDQG